MAVRVYDTIKQGNDLDFPIVDSNAISGGTYYKNTEEERDNLSEEYIIPGAFCYVIENKITYRLQIVNDNEEDLDGIQLIETVNNNFKKYKNSNGELIYKKVINDKDYYLMWKSFGEKTLPTLTYNGSTKLYVNLNEDIKIDINFQSDNYGDCSIVISKNGNSYKTITNKKGNITLTLDRLSSEGTYNYRIQGYDFYGIEATTYIDITIVCGGLKFSSDFVDYLNNNIIGVNRSIPITYNSFSEDETIKYIYLKFELYNEDDINLLEDDEELGNILELENKDVERNLTLNAELFQKAGIYRLVVIQCTNKNFEDISDTDAISYPFTENGQEFHIMEHDTYSVTGNITLQNGEVLDISQIKSNQNLSFNFRAIYYNEINNVSSLHAKLSIYKQNELEPIYYSSKFVTNNTDSSFYIGKLNEGTYKLQLLITKQEVETIGGELIIEPIEVEYVEENTGYKTDNLVAYFDATNRTGSTDNTWQSIHNYNDNYKYKFNLYGLSNNYDLTKINTANSGITFDNVNGWASELEYNLQTNKYEEVKDEQTGNSYMMLKFTGDSYGILCDQNDNPVNPFNSQYNCISIPNSTQNYNAGTTFEIYFKTRFSGDNDARVITCQEKNDRDYLDGKLSSLGYSIGYDKCVLSTSSDTKSLQFLEDEWNHLVFVYDLTTREYNEQEYDIQNLENSNPYTTIRIYLNGSLCGINKVNSTTYVNNSTLPLTINGIPSLVNNNITYSNFGECEIKLIRMYNCALTSSEIMNNYISCLKPDEAEKVKNLNNSEDTYDIPIITFSRVDNISTSQIDNNSTTFSFLNTITDKAISNDKYVACNINVKYKSTSDNSFLEQNTVGQVFLQGTSSLAYPVKNYKIKFVEEFVFKDHQDNVGNNIIDEDNLEKNKIDFGEKGWHLQDGWQKENKITLKCDYMEASHLNNTPTAKLFDELIVNAILNGKQGSPARQKKYKDAIDGFPIILYYQDGSDTPIKYLGTYMFNIDKSGKSLGFEPYEDNEIENSYELTNKCLSFEASSNRDEYAASTFYSYLETAEHLLQEQNLTKYEEYKTNSKDLTIKEKENLFDSGNYEVTDGVEGKDEYKLTKLKYLQNSFELRYDYDEDATEDNLEIEKNKFYILNDAINFISEYYNKVKNEEKFDEDEFKYKFEYYFNEEYTLTYFLQMMMFGQVDNAGKNSMWDIWLKYANEYNEDNSTYYYFDKDADVVFYKDVNNYKYRYEGKKLLRTEDKKYFYYENDEEAVEEYLLTEQPDNLHKYIDENYIKYYGQFYVRPYDMDTQVGLNNTGQDVIGTDAELNADISPTLIQFTSNSTNNDVGDLSSTSISNGSIKYNYWHYYDNGIQKSDSETEEAFERRRAWNSRFYTYNTNQSKFWNLFYKQYTNDITNTYKELRESKCYDVDSLYNFYMNIVNKIGNVYFNRDMVSKFINLKTSQGEYDTTYLDRVNGNRNQRWKRWINDRIIFLDSLYDYRQDKFNSISFRSDTSLNPSESFLEIETYSPMYIKLSIGLDNSADISTFYVSPEYFYENVGQTKTYGTKLRLGNMSLTNKEMVIYGAGNIKRINLKVFYPSSLDITNLNKISEIDFSGISAISTITLPNSIVVRNINLNNCTSLTGELNLSSSRNLRELYINNTLISKVTFPNTRALNMINLYNSKISSLELLNLKYIKTLNINNCDINDPDGNGIKIENCGLTSFVLNNDNVQATKINITGCEELENICLNKLIVSGEINIYNNKKLNCFIMYDNNSTGLEKLNLTNNVNLQVVDVHGDSNLKQLYLSQTKEDGTNHNLRLLYLYNCSALNKISNDISSTENIVDISFLKNLIIHHSNRYKLVEGETSYSTGFFDGCSSMTKVKIDNSDVDEGVTSFYRMFYRCTNLEEFAEDSKLKYYNKYFNDSLSSDYVLKNNIEDYNLDKITNDYYSSATQMFRSCSSLRNLDNINFISLYGIKSINSVFISCPKLNFNHVQNFLQSTRKSENEESSITDISGLFRGFGSQNTTDGNFIDIGIDDTTNKMFNGFYNVTSANYIFWACTNIRSVNLDILKDIGKNSGGTNANQLFISCSNLEYVYKTSINNDKLYFKSLYGLFSGNRKLKGIYIINNNEINSNTNFFDIFDETLLNNATNFSRIFYNCNNLISSKDHIQETITELNNKKMTNIFNLEPNEDDNNHNNILDKCINMTSAAGIFAKCSSINHEFPNAIFKNNTKLTTIEQAFAECNFSKIEKETQLFDNNSLYNNLTNLAGLFYKVPFSEDSIAGSFLFANSNGGAKNATNLSRGSNKVGGVNASVHETYGIFGGSYLRQFDYQIFINLKKLQDISYMFYNNIDKYNRKIEFINTTNNNSLNDSMSLEIFNGKDNNKNETIQNMSYMFYKCNIKGVFSDTPNDLKFGNFVKLQNVSHMFYGATFDNTIDLSNLFKDNIYLNNLSGCFANSNLDYKMSNLKEDSEESPIFDNLNSSGSSTIDLSGLFYNTKICGKLPINLFNGIRNLISDISLMFYDCKYLGGEISSEDCNFNNDNFIPTGNTKDKITLTISKQTEDDYLTIKVDVDVNGFLGGCTELTNVKGLFGGCVRLKGAIPDDLFYLPDTIIYNDEQYANSTTFKITDISYLFDSCINLDRAYSKIVNGITSYYICNPDIFKFLPNVKNASNVFRNLYSIGHNTVKNDIDNEYQINIPNGLFNKMTTLQDASYAFYTHNNLDSVNFVLKENSTEYIIDNNKGFTRYIIDDGCLNDIGDSSRLFNKYAINNTLNNLSGCFLYSRILYMNKNCFSYNENTINKALLNVSNIFFRCKYNHNSNTDYSNISLPNFKDNTKFSNIISSNSNYAYGFGNSDDEGLYKDMIISKLSINNNDGMLATNNNIYWNMTRDTLNFN